MTFCDRRTVEERPSIRLLVWVPFIHMGRELLFLGATPFVGSTTEFHGSLYLFSSFIPLGKLRLPVAWSSVLFYSSSCLAFLSIFRFPLPFPLSLGCAPPWEYHSTLGISLVSPRSVHNFLPNNNNNQPNNSNESIFRPRHH